MTNKILLIEHKTTEFLIDLVGENIIVQCKGHEYHIDVDGKFHHGSQDEIANIYISNDDLMFNRLVPYRDPDEKDKWFDSLILVPNKEYSFKEIRDKFYNNFTKKIKEQENGSTEDTEY